MKKLGDYMSNGFKNLIVWNKAYDLSLKIHNITKSYPKDEKFGITSQLRRASYSIVANIAEGYGRSHRKEYINFVSIALSSCNEVEVFLMLSKDLDYLGENEFKIINNKNTEIIKMLIGLRKALRKNI